MKTFLFLVLVIFGVRAIPAAEVIHQLPLTPVAQALINAKVTAKRGDAVGAEQLLLAANHAPVGTFDWQIESAQRLIRLAYALPREGSMLSVSAVVTSALQHLVVAESLAVDARHKAVAKALAGNVYENFRGDRASALASYSAAAQLAPDHTSAVRAADRLQRTADILRTRKGS